MKLRACNRLKAIRILRVLALAVFAVLALRGLLYLRPVAPSFLSQSERRAQLKKTKPIPVADVVKPPPKQVKSAVAPVKHLPLSQGLRPQVASTLMGFGSGSGDFGGGFSEDGTGGGRASGVVAQAAVERTARVTSRASLAFPAQAREKNISGYVVVEVLVGTSGQIERSRVVAANPPGVFEASALDSIRQWRFEPAMASGQAVASWVTQKIRFDLE